MFWHRKKKTDDARFQLGTFVWTSFHLSLFMFTEIFRHLEREMHEWVAVRYIKQCLFFFLPIQCPVDTHHCRLLQISLIQLLHSVPQFVDVLADYPLNLLARLSLERRLAGSYVMVSHVYWHLLRFIACILIQFVNRCSLATPSRLSVH